MKKSYYHDSLTKRLLDLTVSLALLIFFLPFLLVIAVLLMLTQGPPLFFIQNRTGKDGKVFKMIKFRSMIPNADKMKNKLASLNESDGPVFKIKNDPRFTFVGKWLSGSGLDELPQIFNVLKGDMSIVGPRPLPVYEEKRLKRTHRQRNLIRPGITSGWVVNGSHSLSFSKWMRLDIEYIKNGNFSTDIFIIIKTTIFMLSKYWQ